MRVRWHEWAKLREWMDCTQVSIAGEFVVIATERSVIVVPRHRIYGQLEVEPRPKSDVGEVQS